MANREIIKVGCDDAPRLSGLADRHGLSLREGDTVVFLYRGKHFVEHVGKPWFGRVVFLSDFGWGIEWRHGTVPFDAAEEVMKEGR